MDEGEGVGGDVGVVPQHVVLRQAWQRVLQQHARQEDRVKNREGLQQVGEARLQLNILLVESPHTEEVT